MKFGTTLRASKIKDIVARVEMMSQTGIPQDQRCYELVLLGNDLDNVDTIIENVRRFDLMIESVHSPFTTSDPREFSKYSLATPQGRSTFLEAARLTQAVGARKMVVHSGTYSIEQPSADTYVQTREFVLETLGMAAEFGILPCLENIPYPTFRGPGRDILSTQFIEFALEIASDAGVGFCLDTAHLMTLYSNIEALRQILTGKITHAHLSNMQFVEGGGFLEGLVIDGKGNFDESYIRWLMEMLPNSAAVILEIHDLDLRELEESRSTFDWLVPWLYVNGYLAT